MVCSGFFARHWLRITESPSCWSSTCFISWWISAVFIHIPGEMSPDQQIPKGSPRGCEALQQLVAMIPTFCFTYPGLEHVEEACHGLFQSMESHSMPRFVLIPLWKRSMYPPFWEEANEWVCVSMKVRYIVQMGITDEMLAMAEIQDWHSKTSPTWAVVFDSLSEREREREIELKIGPLSQHRVTIQLQMRRAPVDKYQVWFGGHEPLTISEIWVCLKIGYPRSNLMV